MHIKALFRKYLLLYLFSLIIIGLPLMSGCKKESKTNTSTGTSPNFVGQTYQGGIVAYIFETGDPGYVAGESHGLIAAPADLDSMPIWGRKGTWITGAHDTFLGSGQQNTLDILKYGDTPNVAAWYCDQLDIHGHDDWYLPSKMELQKLYQNRVKIGGFNYLGAYWSSCQNNANKAWLLNFKNGADVGTDKTTKAIVRAVRSF